MMKEYPCKLLKNGAESEANAAELPEKTKTPAFFEVSFCPPLSIRNLLYEYPLYRSQNGETLHILIFTHEKSECFADFLDAALQLGQMQDTRLLFTIAVKNPQKVCENYLSKRPALSRFVDIAAGNAESLPAYDPEKYGQICFCEPKMLFGDKKGYVKTKSIASHILQDGQYQYILSDLGTPEKNHELVELYTELCQDTCTVAAMPPASSQSRMKISASLVYMAFCADLVWSGSMEWDMQQKLHTFLQGDSYRLASSLAFVLSLQYKLHSMGIEGTNQEMAETFHQLILQCGTDADGKPNAAEQTVRILAALEHRRWVLEKISNGWDAPRRADGSLDLESIAALDDTKDRENKLHPCIVFSTPDMPLCSEEYTKENHKKWRKSPQGLDELDAMSVSLYKRFYQKAEDFRKQDPMAKNHDLQELRHLLGTSNNSAVRDSLRRYEFCLSNILSGSQKYAETYSFYQNQLCSAASAISRTVSDQVKLRTAMVGKAFFAARESCLFHDFKEIDRKMILQIPFILTFRPVENIALHFTDGAQTANGQIFQNVASLTVLSPQRAHFLFWFSRGQDPALVRLRLAGMMQYLINRPAPKKVTFTVACSSDVPEERLTMLQECLAEVQKQYPALLEEITLYSDVPIEDVCDLLLRSARQHDTTLMDCSLPLTGSVIADSTLISKIRKIHLPFFELDTLHRRFRCSDGCRFLDYLHTNAYLRAEDMFVLMGCQTESSYMPDRPERYRELWEIYTGSYIQNDPEYQFRNGVKNWNALGDLLDQYMKARNPVQKIPLTTDGAALCTLHYVLEYPMYDFILDEIFPPLIRNGIISKDSAVSVDLHKQTAVTLQGVISWAKNSLHQLFTTSIYTLKSSGYPVYTVRREDKGELQFYTADLNVSNMNLTGSENSSLKHCSKLLEALRQEKLIRQYVKNGDSVSFSFCSPEIMQYLSQSGQILELHVFYKLLASGWFDDVVCGYQLNYQGVSNELDIVATKGFQSFIIECKAVRALSSEYYYKLHSISQVFGINVTNILAGNLYLGENATEKERYNDQLHKRRGDSLGIISLTGKEEILNIDEHLIRIASGI